MTGEPEFREVGEGGPELEDAHRAELDGLIAELGVGAQRWQELSLHERARVLHRIQQGVGPLADEWAQASAYAKHGMVDDTNLGAEYLAGPYALARSAGALSTSLNHLAAGRRPVGHERYSAAPGGRVALKVLPLDSKERLIFNGFHVEAWQQAAPLSPQQSDRPGLERRSEGVAVVLAASGVNALALVDALDEVVVRGRAALVKVHSRLGGLIPLYERALAPLVELDVVRFTADRVGRPVREYLMGHPGIARARITGNAIPFGSVRWGAELGGAHGERRLSTAGSFSGAGGATAVAIIPSHWSPADVAFQAKHVASIRRQNVLYGTGSAQVIVLPSDWPQAREFMAAVRSELEVLPADDGEQLDALQRRHADESVIGLVELPGDSTAFASGAVEYVNAQLYGALGHVVLIDPMVRRQLGPRFEQLLSAVRIGNIGVNTWTGFGFLAPLATWGMYPGVRDHDISEGIGVIHNGLLLAAPERTIATGPFRPAPRSLLNGEFSFYPTPPWWKGSRNALRAGRLLTQYAVRPSWRLVLRILLSGLVRR